MSKLLKRLLPFLVLGGLIGGDGENVYRKLHSSKEKFSKFYRYHDPDRDRTLVPFHVHGDVVMAYSRKDAIKRWVHMDYKNRKKR